MLKKIGKNKFIILILIIILLLTTQAEGVFAWLSDNDNLLFNKFTYGNIKISITESDVVENNKTYEISPGMVINKDTKVLVEAGSEDCWLFINILETDNFKDFMTYSVADGWTLLEENSSVYYQEVSKSENIQSFDVIKDNKINVKEELNKSDLVSLNGNYPSISISAYAIQRNKEIDAIASAKEAWLLLSNQNN